MLLAFPKIAGAIPFGIVNCIASSIKKALQHIHSRGLCFADVKPSNILLGEGRAILCDLAAVVKMDDRIIESTQGYALDYPNTDFGNPKLDWVCLGATICQLLLLNVNISDHTSRVSLLQKLHSFAEVHDHAECKPAVTIALNCLSIT